MSPLALWVFQMPILALGLSGYQVFGASSAGRVDLLPEQLPTHASKALSLYLSLAAPCLREEWGAVRCSLLESPGGKQHPPQIMAIAVLTSQNPGVSEKYCGSVKSQDEPWGAWAYSASSQVPGNP